MENTELKQLVSVMSDNMTEMFKLVQNLTKDVNTLRTEVEMLKYNQKLL